MIFIFDVSLRLEPEMTNILVQIYPKHKIAKIEDTHDQQGSLSMTNNLFIKHFEQVSKVYLPVWFCPVIASFPSCNAIFFLLISAFHWLSYSMLCFIAQAAITIHRKSTCTSYRICKHLQLHFNFFEFPLTFTLNNSKQIFFVVF